MFIKRFLGDVILKSSKKFPVITLTGPRQSGKTTLLRNLFPDLPYKSLENPDARLLAINDPRAFLNKIESGAILDEIQQAPELLSYIQEIADSKPKVHFILSGSSNFSLMQNITQSLAGRTALFKLLPFSFDEIGEKIKKLTDDEWILNGFYPAVHAKKQDISIYYRSYYETYIERDVRQLINIKDIKLFQLFIKLCAGRIGNILNISSIANEVGVSSVTIKQWLTVLEASYIIYTLPPYYENFGKRLIKSPKLFFTDTGLACYLLGIESVNQLSRDPLRGALFENMVVAELIKQRLNRGYDSNLYFYRDSNHNEIDVLIKQGSKLIPVEIKSSQTFHKEFLKTLLFSEKFLKRKKTVSFLIYAGKQEQNINRVEVINFRNINSINL